MKNYIDGRYVLLNDFLYAYYNSLTGKNLDVCQLECMTFREDIHLLRFLDTIFRIEKYSPYLIAEIFD